MKQIGVTDVLTAIGLMSGTSMDGIDAALLQTDGEAVAIPGPALALPYPTQLRRELRAVLDRAAAARDVPGLRASLAELEARLTALNAQAVAALLERAGLSAGEVDLVGYHGQTVLHRPAAGVTVQLGDGIGLAAACGISVVNDFRAADVAAGGEGAPFAPAYHVALAARSGAAPLAVVNIGGVANVTWIAPGRAPIAMDTGPGNALIDDFMHGRTGAAHDEGGRLALSGQVDEAALAALMTHAYFDRPPPKSLDRNAFSAEPVGGLADADGAATLVAFTVRSILAAARFFPEPAARFVVTGGGRHNAAIMDALAAAAGAPVVSAEAAGWRGDDLEAEAFAYLAVRSLRGLPLSWPTTTGVPHPLTGGVLSPPPSPGDAAQRARRLSR